MVQRWNFLRPRDGPLDLPDPIAQVAMSREVVGAWRSARTAMEIGLVPSLTALQRALPALGKCRAVSRFTAF